MGPLQGIKIIEVAGIGPGPFAAMLIWALYGPAAKPAPLYQVPVFCSPVTNWESTSDVSL